MARDLAPLPAPIQSDALPLQQTSAYAAALSRLGAGTRQIDLPGQAQMLVSSRRTLLGPLSLTSRGPVWQAGDADARRAFLRDHGPQVINAEDPDPAVLRAAGYWQVMTPATQASLDLGTDLVAGMHPKWRANWRQSQTDFVQIEIGRFDPLMHHWMISLERAQRRMRGYRGYPPEFLLAFASANPGQARAVVARAEDVPIAAMVFLIHGASATYHLGWSGETGREVRAHYRMLHEAALNLAAEGVTRLDLGLVDTHRAPGLARFKLGSGAAARTLGGTWLRRNPWKRGL